MISRLRHVLSVVGFCLVVSALIAQDLDSVIDSAPPPETATATEDRAVTSIQSIDWDEIIFDEPPTAAQWLASQTLDLQTQAFGDGFSPLGILIQIIRQLGQNFGGGALPVPGTGIASGPASPGTPPAAASGTTIASGSGASGTVHGRTDEEFEAQAREIIDQLKADGATPGTGIGDSPAKLQIGGFPTWFGELQSLIVGRRTWGDLEERGRRLLGEYANRWAATNLPQPTPHGLAEFFKYLGCCETNDDAIRRHDASLPRSGDFFGSKGGVNWCAFASNRAYMQPMMDAGFSFAGNYAWANNTKYVPQYGRGHPKFSVMPGDYISNGTHVMTVLKVNGDRVTVVSGNAGGGPENGAGTVRIEEISYGKIEVVKKHSDFTLEMLQAHADDADWLKAHGIARK